MGIFKIHPKGSSTITCSMMEDSSTDYQVMPTSVDTASQARLKVIYSDGNAGGSIKQVKRGLVPFTFTILVFGASQATAIDNARTVELAICNADGGHVEYRPIGLGDSVLTTWYEYLQSKPPEIIRRGQAWIDNIMERYGQAGREQEYAVMLKCQVMTKAWATSDPQTHVSIVSSATIDNHDDAADSNYVTVLNSNIKGNAVIPIIKVDDPSTDAGKLLIYKKKEIPGSSTNADVIEAEDMSQSGTWTAEGPDASASNDDYLSTTEATPALYETLHSKSINSTYLGKMTPILIARAASGTVYKCTFSLRDGVGQILATPRTIDIGYESGDWQIFYEFGEVDFPPFALPDYLDDDTSPTIGDYAMNGLRIYLDFERTSGSGALDVDCFVLGKASEWIAYGQPRGDYIGLYQLWFDAITGNVALMATDETLQYNAEKYGGPLSDMICMKGFDYRFRFYLSDVDTGVIDVPSTFDVQIDGIYATIFPFEEA